MRNATIALVVVVAFVTLPACTAPAPAEGEGEGEEGEGEEGEGDEGEGDEGEGEGEPEDCAGAPADAPGAWTLLDPVAELSFEGLVFAGSEPNAVGLSGIAFGNGRFVTVAQSAGLPALFVLTSTTGTEWTVHTIDPPDGGTTGGATKVRFQRDRFIFFAGFIDGGAHVFTSTNGVDWDHVRFGDGNLGITDFASNGDITVFAGANNLLASSTDLVTWTPHTVDVGSFSHGAIAAGNGRFVISSNGGVPLYTSEDGAAWTQIAPPLIGFGVAFGNGNFVATSFPNVQTSPDGVTFTAQEATGDRSGFAPIFTGGRFITLGVQSGDEMPIAASSDGITWTPFGSIPLPAVPEGANGNINGFVDVACGACTCVWVGSSISGPYTATNPFTQDNNSLMAFAHVLAAE